jgi:hypothetical protein
MYGEPVATGYTVSAPGATFDEAAWSAQRGTTRFAVRPLLATHLQIE